MYSGDLVSGNQLSRQVGVNVRMKVKDSAAVVVGGASGMGRATAEQLMQKGARVAVLDLPTSEGAAIANELGASFHPCDVTDSDGVEDALAAAVEQLGALHVAVNTAGGGVSARTLSKNGPHPLDAFRSV